MQTRSNVGKYARRRVGFIRCFPTSETTLREIPLKGCYVPTYSSPITGGVTTLCEIRQLGTLKPTGG